jgi:hypothetical protein
MIATRRSLLVVPLLCGALVAGCGSSSSTTSSATSTSAPATSSTNGVGSTASTATSPSASSGAVVAGYVAVCKSIIEAAPTLSASVKAKLEGICKKAGSGDAAGAKTAAKEVCIEVIDATPVTGAPKEKALAACNYA